MQLYRGVYPIKSIQLETTEDICEEAINLVSAKQIVEPGDIVVLTAGIPARSEGMAKEYWWRLRTPSAVSWLCRRGTY